MELSFVVTIFIFQVTQVNPAPIAENFKHVQKIQKYMTSFGYLPKVSSGKKLLLNEKGFERGLRQLQTFAGIPETGVVDDQTVEILKIPRCGLPDLPDGQQDYYPSPRRHRRSVQGSSWTKSVLTYKVGKYPTGLNQSEVDADVKKAFKMWSEASGLTFRCKQSQGAKVDIELRFENYYHGDEDSFDGPGGHVAHAFYPQYGGDAHFDNKEYWTVNKFTVNINFTQICKSTLVNVDREPIFFNL